MIRQPSKQILQPSVRLDAIGLRAADERIMKRRPAATVVTGHKQIVLPPDRWSFHRPFGKIIAVRQKAPGCITAQRIPLIQRAGERRSNWALGQDPLVILFRIEPRFESFQNRNRMLLPRSGHRSKVTMPLEIFFRKYKPAKVIKVSRDSNLTKSFATKCSASLSLGGASLKSKLN